MELGARAEWAGPLDDLSRRGLLKFPLDEQRPTQRAGTTSDSDRSYGETVALAATPVEWGEGVLPVLRYFPRLLRQFRDRMRVDATRLKEELLLWNGKSFATPLPSKLSALEHNAQAITPLDLIELSRVLEPTGTSPGETLLDACTQLPTHYLGGMLAESESGRLIASLVHSLREAYKVIRASRVDEAESAALTCIRKTLAPEFGSHVFSAADGVPEGQFGALVEKRLADQPEGAVAIIVDAIDGHRIFDRHLPTWSMAAGALRWKPPLDESTRPILEPLGSAVFNPPTGELFVALEGGGAALLNEHERTVEPLHTSREFYWKRTMIGTHISTSHPRESMNFTQHLLRRLPPITDRVVMVGSGQLALAYVGAGRLDAYCNPITNPWHCLAGQIIVRVAGREASLAASPNGTPHCLVTDFHGEPWTMHHNSILAVGNPWLHESLRGLLAIIDAEVRQ